MNQLKHYRENAGLTQQELADRAGTTRSYIAELEGGKKSPSVYLAQKLSRAVKSKVEKVFPEAE